VVKNTETAKQNGGIHNERVFLNRVCFWGVPESCTLCNYLIWLDTA
jgi:hypothetical protein